MRSLTLAAVALVVVALVSLSGTAQADYIAISNHSFDALGLADGGYGAAIPTGWTAYNPAGFAGPPDLWGEYNPNNNAIYDTCSPDAAPGTPGMDGYTCFFGAGTIVLAGSGLEQTLSTSFALDTDYALTAAYGRRNLASMSPVTMELLAGTTVIGTQVVDPNTTGTLGQFSDYALSVSAASVSNPAALVGQSLGIRFYKSNGSTEIEADNFRLDGSAIPEPGTLALLASGMLGLLAYAWRKRR